MTERERDHANQAILGRAIDIMLADARRRTDQETYGHQHLHVTWERGKIVSIEWEPNITFKPQTPEAWPKLESH